VSLLHAFLLGFGIVVCAWVMLVLILFVVLCGISFFDPPQRSHFGQ